MQIPLQSVLMAFSFFKKKRDLIGIDIGSHAIKLVYLKGSPGQWSLVRWGVIPYYLHQLDPVQGAGHFAVPEGRGAALIAFLQKNFSGYGVPRLVREEPHYPSKIFISC